MTIGRVNRPRSPLRLGLLACVVGCAASASAADRVSRSSVRMKVGQTRSLGTFGGHSGDCMRSVPPEIRITQPPTLGTLSERENVPFVAKVSLSGTCLGARFMGTQVLYTASSPGSETMAFDAAFPNGTDHHVVSVTVR